ncbi:kinase domain containing protein [Coccidioides posadasii C735 delta SOWgp]|uniref:Carbon catabolite-derepressing protein kinase n=2 Tax=Coccidioides posadasii TaxID=199306 RepID=A0A0J6FLJ2_COCPO|nr:kinase domain containing protein [Coccidioides posadasii C735 delta SOWgp]EER25996.1 kinase domain containing protein [Coccidioides posadasii C735 delta SOWgp]KMM69739.1 carbon catabolite-derepressing protein kinase [Coccidioides posadasii RMSCC 3488]|eukprot:XP_003068141.1 kinase domain containing protein [Coccidioides posadasii C735 delta SOWgp]
MPPQKEKSSLKRGRASGGNHEQDVKKPRRSERLSSQLAQSQAARANKAYLPPLIQQDSTATEIHKEATVTPPEGRPSQLRHHTPGPESLTQLSSPPGDTQAFSQNPSRVYVSGVEEEAAEGVWGYLIPLDNKFGDTLVLKKRDTCFSSPIGGVTNNRNGASRSKRSKGKGMPTPLQLNPSGYLIGRHSECDLILDIPTISNRHCLIFHENREGDSVAILEDLSSNGTFVNEAIVGRNNRRELEDGDEVTVLDEARFIFRYPRNRDAGGFRQQYRILEQLGKGHFATVYLCAERATGIKYAVKRFEKRPGDSHRSDNDTLQQEIAMLKSVNHTNVLCLKDTFDESDGVYLVLELAPEGELFNWIVSHQKLKEDETRHVFRQLFQGLKYLHDRNIVHRDIKPENILLMDKHLTAKLADFGLAKIIGEDSFTTTLCGTPSYVAPEILENSRRRRYTRAVDIWSLGVVLYICLCGFPPFSDELYSAEHPYTLAEQIKLGNFDYPSPYWDSVGDLALDLIDRMLTVDVDQRASIDECLQHPWLTGKYPSVADSTDGLTGAMGQLDFSKRKVERERTLLSDINDVPVSQVYDDSRQEGYGQVKIFDKNTAGKRVHNQPAKGLKYRQEPKPDVNRDPVEFMHMGGRGDQTLFAHDPDSRYESDEVPRRKR